MVSARATLEPLDSIPAPQRWDWKDNRWYYWGLLQQRILADNANYPNVYEDTSDAPINADTNARNDTPINADTNAWNSPAGRSNVNNVVNLHDDLDNLDDNKAGADNSNYVNAHALTTTKPVPTTPTMSTPTLPSTPTPTQGTLPPVDQMRTTLSTFTTISTISTTTKPVPTILTTSTPTLSSTPTPTQGTLPPDDQTQTTSSTFTIISTTTKPVPTILPTSTPTLPSTPTLTQGTLPPDDQTRTTSLTTTSGQGQYDIVDCSPINDILHITLPVFLGQACLSTSPVPSQTTQSSAAASEIIFAGP